MGKCGYIYALVNPSMEGLVKVGKTTNNPDKRANELSSVTGLPFEFIVAHSVLVRDCDLAEKYVHGLLKKRGARVSSNREFFAVTLTEAIEAIESTAAFIGTTAEENLTRENFVSILIPDHMPNAALTDLELKASNYWNKGVKQVIEKTLTESEYIATSIDLQNKAIKAGSIRAYYMLGRIHLTQAIELDQQIRYRSFIDKLFGDDRENRKNNHIREGLESHRIALKKGYDLSYAALADYFGTTENVSEAKKHWDLFFRSKTFIERLDPYGEFWLYCVCYESFLGSNLNMDWNEARFLANEKFDV